MRFLVLILLALEAVSAAPSMEMWYRQPAKEGAGFPLGNGNLQTTVAGNPSSERLKLGMDSFLVLDWLDADEEIKDYRRSLDLRDHLAVTRWKRGDSTITTTILASGEDDVLAVHLLADKPGALNFRVRFEGKGRRLSGERGELILRSGRWPRMTETRAWVMPFESEVSEENGTMTVRGEGEAMILIRRLDYIALRESKRGFERPAPELRKKYGGGSDEEHTDFTKVWAGIRDAHVRKHRADMDRIFVDLGGHEAALLPTDERERQRGGVDPFDPATGDLPVVKPDPNLAVLGFHYSRYLNGLPGSDLWVSSELRGKLVGAEDGRVTLLPALPPEWKDGEVRGYPAGRDFTVDMTWKDGKVTAWKLARASDSAPKKVNLRVNGQSSELWVE